MNILRYILIVFTLLGFCQDLFAGDYPETVNKFLQELAGDYLELSYDRDYEHVLESSGYIWKKQVLLKGKKSLQDKYNQKVYPRLYLSFFWYRDSQSCQEAFSKWLGCFGAACVTLDRGKYVAATKK